MRALALLPLLTLFACGESGEQAPPPPKKASAAEAAAAAAPAQAPSAPVQEAREGARDLIRRYYDHIEAGRYAEAWAMRGGEGEGAEAFARSFAPYRSYRAMVGEPSEPVAASGWSFVEVPVMITGTLKDGKGFGSAGSISLRRAAGAPGATPAQKKWHIYTGD